MAKKNPTVSFHSLPHADGSATYSHCGYTVVGSVNGPLEPQRRDELPEEAFVEVHIRPATGVGGPRDRALETIIHRTIVPIILTTHHPRTLIQITLQLLSTPSASSSAAPPHQSTSLLPSLPHLVHTALLALLAANIPLRTTCTATLAAVTTTDDGEDVDIQLEPDDKHMKKAGSLHVFAFDAGDVGRTGETKEETNGKTAAAADPDEEEAELLLVESEGEFDEAAWERAARLAEKRCRGAGGLQEWLRDVVGEMVRDAGKWRG